MTRLLDLYKRRWKHPDGRYGGIFQNRFWFMFSSLCQDGHQRGKTTEWKPIVYINDAPNDAWSKSILYKPTCKRTLRETDVWALDVVARAAAGHDVQSVVDPMHVVNIKMKH